MLPSAVFEKTRESYTYGEAAVWAKQVVEILDVAADDDLMDADELAAAQFDLEVRVPLAVEERCVVHGGDVKEDGVFLLWVEGARRAGAKAL